MIRSIKLASCLVIVFLAIYGAGTFGCQYFSSLAKSCGQSGLFVILPLGLMYIAVFLSMVIIPIWTIIYLRVTVIMGFSIIFFGDYKTLESKLSGWLTTGK